jgi:transposase
LSGKRYRCSKCKYTFTDFTGRLINKLRIFYKKWLWILRLFELEISAMRIAQQVELSYPTVLKAVHLIRITIIAADKGAEDLLKGEVEIDETYFGGKRKCP